MVLLEWDTGNPMTVHVKEFWDNCLFLERVMCVFLFVVTFFLIKASVMYSSRWYR